MTDDETPADAEAPKPVYCSSCGERHVDGAKFCRECGTALATASATSDAASPGPAKSRRKLWAALAVLAAVIAVASLAAIAIFGDGAGAKAARKVKPPKPATHTVTGTFDLHIPPRSDQYADDKYVFHTGASCEGHGGYADMGPTTDVTLYDGAGEILSTTSLGDGTYQAKACHFAFTLLDVPNRPFYQLEIGSDRGKIRVSHADMLLTDWTVGETLGDDTP